MEASKSLPAGASVGGIEENSAPTPGPKDSPFSNSASDNLLIAHICQRDERALGVLYDRYGTLVYTIALRITRDRAVAEEVVQDVFQAIWQAAGGFQVEGTVKPWLLGIVRHRAIDATRVRNYQVHTTAIAFDEQYIISSIGHTDDVVDALTIREALAAVPPIQRHVIELAYYGGMTRAEIAIHLGEPVGTVKTRLRLGLLKLRTLLQPSL
jgi:RNA polymerase sigma-70 factor (ECF subfamily)